MLYPQGEDACLDNRQSLIFVSIASYRDPQLVATIADCIAKANDPDGLRFGICWQHDAADPPFPYLDDPRFRVLDVDWRESRGACWARAEIMKLWQEEDWYLQVDSHCRFAPGWDEKMLRAVMQTGSAKPILSTYATGFTPGENEMLRDEPLQMALQAFTSDGIPQLKPAPSVRVGWPPRPARARFLSGGFLFTIGDFVEEVPYDPDLYFMGEESAMTLRAYTHGYDLFHPSRTLVWHDYIRMDARKHWGDHTEANALSRTISRTWSDFDTPSRQKVKRLLLGEPVEGFGLGSERTIEEYEAYAGLSLKRRRAQEYTMRAAEPPNPPAPADWPDRIYPWIAKIIVQRAAISEDSFEDPHLWMVGIFDERSTEIYRRDVTADELASLPADGPEIVILLEFTSGTVPVRWLVWPMSKPKGWLTKIAGEFADGDFALLEEEDTEASDT